MSPKPATRMTPAGHRYYLDGDQVPNVTGITGDGVPKPGLIKWAAERTWGYAIDHWDELARLPISERIKLLEGARFEHLGEAKERGTEVHAQIVRWLHGEEVVPPAGLEGHVDAAIAFCQEWQLAEVLIEAPVFSRTWRYAGRLDLVGDLADGHRWLLDFKTHERGPFTESALQLAAYRYADFYIVAGELDDRGQALEHPIHELEIERTGIVHVRADGWDLYPYAADDKAAAVFAAAQEVAAFCNSPRELWIGESLRPPTSDHNEEAA